MAADTHVRITQKLKVLIESHRTREDDSDWRVLERAFEKANLYDRYCEALENDCK